MPKEILKTFFKVSSGSFFSYSEPMAYPEKCSFPIHKARFISLFLILSAPRDRIAGEVFQMGCYFFALSVHIATDEFPKSGLFIEVEHF